MFSNVFSGSNALLEENSRLKEQVQRRDKQIQRYKDEIDAQASQISGLESNIKNNDLNVLLEENSRLKEQVQRRDKQIQRYKDDIDAQASQISGLESNIKNNDLLEENSRLKEQVQRRDKQIQKYKDDIGAKASEISDLEKSLASLERDIGNRDLTNVKNDKTTSLQKEINVVKDALRGRDERIASLTKIIQEERGRAKDEAEKAEERLKETVDKMKEKMERLMGESRRKEEEVAKLNQQLQDWEAFRNRTQKHESKGALDSMAAERDKLQNLLNDAHNDVVQLRSQLHDSHQKCSELEETARQDAAEAQLLKHWKNETLQRQHEETQETAFNRGHDLKETKKALEAATLPKTETANFLLLQHDVEELKKHNEVLELQLAERQATIEAQKDEIKAMAAERDQLHNLLDDGRSDTPQKLETIRSSFQRSQSVAKDTETHRETLIGQETVKKQVEEIKKIEEDLAEVKESYEAVTEQLRLETERTKYKGKDDKLAAAVVRLQAANSILEELERALSVALGDLEQEINRPCGSSYGEFNVRISSPATSEQEFYTSPEHEDSTLEDMMALRQSLERVRSEERAKDYVVKELESLLKEARDVQRKEEEELWMLASRYAELETRLANTTDRLSQVTILSEEREVELLRTRKELDSMTRQSREMKMTLERQKSKSKGTVDYTTVERDQLRNQIEQKTSEPIRSESQHPQRAMEETGGGMFASRFTHEVVMRQLEQIVKKSREMVTEELRLERERIDT